MKIKVLDRFGRPPINSKSTIFLTRNNWNDFSFYTLFGMLYVDKTSDIHEIGSIKIGYFGQEEGADVFSIGDEFDGLNEKYFSLGQSDTYYSNLNEFSPGLRDEILNSLNDIAKNDELYNRAINERVTRISFFRTISPSTVKSQFKRLVSGGARLTYYKFRFIAPKIKKDSSYFDLTFEVEPISFPPTNIHVLIGRNGVGKTYLTNNMIKTLLEENQSETGIFEFYGKDVYENKFANLISVSFSAFDDTVPRKEIIDKTKGLQYSYIGLKKIELGTDNKVNIVTKSTTELNNEFLNSLEYCRSSKKNQMEGRH